MRDPLEQPVPDLPAGRTARVAAAHADRGDRWSRIGLVATVVCAAALLWSRADYVPIWDGWVYAECAVRAARLPFAFEALRCADHPTHAYLAPLALLQRLWPGGFPVLLLANVLLLALGVVAFARLLATAFPMPELRADRRWLLAAVVVQPVILAGVVQVNPDLGVLVYMLCATAAAIERRHGAMVLFGLLATFSKEMGAVLYVALVGVYLLAYHVPRPVPRDLRTAVFAAVLALMVPVALDPRDRNSVVVGTAAAVAIVAIVLWVRWRRGAQPTVGAMLRAARPFLPLLTPPVALGAYLAYRAATPHATVLWQGETGSSILPMFLLPHVRGGVPTFSAMMLVLSFQWVIAAVLLADLGVGLARRLRKAPKRELPSVRADHAFFLGVLTAVTCYLLTRPVTTTIPRYVLPAYPLLLSALLLSMLRLRVTPGLRRAVLAALPLLFAASAVRTIDPLSRALWGTFPVGHRDMLTLNSLHGGCCGYGLDQSVYNLEFTAFAALQDSALARVAAAAPDTLVIGHLAHWNAFGPRDPAGRRTLAGDSATAPRLLVAEWLSSYPELPRSSWYVAMPFIDNAAPMAELRRHYTVGEPDTVSTGPYAMLVFPLTLPPAAPVRPERSTIASLP